MADRIISEQGDLEYRRGRSQATRVRPEEPKDPAKRRRMVGAAALLATAGLGIAGKAFIDSSSASNEQTEAQSPKKDTVGVLLEKNIKPDYLFTGKIRVNRRTVFRVHPSITDSNTEGESVYLSDIKTLNGQDVSDQTIKEFTIDQVPFKSGFNPDTHMNDGKGLWGMALIGFGGTEELRYFSDSATTESAGVVVPDRNSGSFIEVSAVNSDGIELARLPLVARSRIGVVKPIKPA